MPITTFTAQALQMSLLESEAEAAVECLTEIGTQQKWLKNGILQKQR